MSAEFLLTALIIAAAPGTGVLVVLAAGLSRGTRAAMLAALGCTLGIVPHLLLAISGLAALLTTNAMAFGALKFIGVAYLLWMAWAMLTAEGATRVDPPPRDRRDQQVVVRAVLANLLNPKLSMFFLAFLPQFVEADAKRPVALMLQLSAAFMLMTLAVFVVYGLCAARIRHRLDLRPAALRRVRWGFAGAFVVLGLRLAFAQRA
jgi:threonine/homoserine/homoserine lactone efflux protein